MRVPRAAACFWIACSLGACSRIERTHECAALLAKVNPALDAVGKLATPEAGADPAKLRVLADRYEALSKSVAAAPPSDADLAVPAKDLAGIFKDTADALRALGDALADPAKAARAMEERRRLSALAGRERIAAGRIDGVCRGR